MRLSTSLLITAAALALALPAAAKPAYVAKAKAAGIADAKCTTCHVKMGVKDLNENGKFAAAHMKNGEPDWVAFKKNMK
jgi:cytochrome c553